MLWILLIAAVAVVAGLWYKLGWKAAFAAIAAFGAAIWAAFSDLFTAFIQ